MTSLIINFFSRFFRARIDRALDDGQPPRGLTEWALRRSPELQRHYESMLGLELALRFAPLEDESSAVPRHAHAVAIAQSTTLSRRVAWLPHIAAAAAVLIAFVAVLRQSKEYPTTAPPENIAVADSEPFSEITLLADAFVNTTLPPLGFPVETVVGFAESPLTTTLSILKTAGIVSEGETMTN